MKIRDLNLDDYVIVYDIGKSEYSEGMTVVGRVEELEFKDANENTALINSMGNLYEITDRNYFELWSNYIESKTESVSEVRIKDLNVGDTIQIPNGKLPLEGKVKSVSGDIAHIEIPMVGHRFISDESDFKRIRKASKPLDPTKWLEKAVKENSKKTKSVLESGLGVSKPATVYNQSNDLQQRKRNKKIVQCSDDIKLKFIERVIQDLSPLAAYHIGNAIDVLAVAESKEDIEQARWSIQRAYENWD